MLGPGAAPTRPLPSGGGRAQPERRGDGYSSHREAVEYGLPSNVQMPPSR